MAEASKEIERTAEGAAAGSLADKSRQQNGSTGSRSRFFSRAAGVRLLVLTFAITAWELLAEFDIVSEDYVSKPSAIAMAAVELAQDPDAVTATVETLGTVGTAFAIGTSAGLLAGIVIGLQPLLREAYLPIVMLMLGTPKAVLLPVLVALFGLTGGSEVAFGVLLAFVYVTVNTVGGVDLIEQRHLSVASAYRASPINRFRHVILPAASPGIFTALWHGLRNAFLGVVIAQLFGASSGIGGLVRIYTNNFQAAEALATVLTVSVAIILVGTAWNHLERRLTRWQIRETK